MILVVGKNLDDILYLKEKFIVLKEEILPSGRTLFTVQGEKGPFLLVASEESNYLSILLLEEVLASHKVEKVFSIGGAASISPKLHVGEIVIATASYLHGVNYQEESKEYGALYKYGPAFPSSEELSHQLDIILTKNGVKHVLGEALSGEKIIFSKEEFDSIKKRRYLGNENLLIYDTYSAGLALASQIRNIPFLNAKIVSFVPDGGEGRITYRRDALKYSDILSEAILEMM
ncbi:MAG: hypothetical protein K5694_07345 [Bacilli bacterium]|nr:hypothetical protein [Bacilli bacterium]